MTDLFDDLENLDANGNIDLGPTRPDGKFSRQTFPCKACGGTGKWSAGRANYRGNSKCNACSGVGYFVTSEAERRKARASRQATKARKVEAAREQNSQTGLVDKLRGMASWNDFAASLVEQHMKGRVWSEKQTQAALRMVDKVEASRKAKAAEREAAATSVDLNPILDMFQTALDSGYKRPMYRAEALRIKPAGNKPGVLYVLTENRMEYGHYGEQPGYEGKVVNGVFQPSNKCAPDTAALLQLIAQDPRGAAVRYGRRTGTCSCCGRELTKHASIEAGIGPVCAQKWGL